MTDSPTQEWKVINEAPMYEMNNLGEVRNIETQKEIKGTIDRGYRVVNLRLLNSTKRKTFLTHRLYAKLFIPNPENKPFAVFMSKDKKVISSDNVRWMNDKERADQIQKLSGVTMAELRKKAIDASVVATGIPINFIDEKGNTKFYPSASACARAEGMTLYHVLKRME